jgi:hypothetical protein
MYFYLYNPDYRNNVRGQQARGDRSLLAFFPFLPRLAWLAFFCMPRRRRRRRRRALLLL